MIVWNKLSSQQQQETLNRPVMKNKQGLTDAVSSIISKVKQNGDKAIVSLTNQFDGIELLTLSLPEQLKQQSLAKLTTARKQAIELAYQNIKKFHLAQKKNDISVDTMPGVNCQLKTAAIAEVGLYIPGGSAPLPSTVLMLGVPAQIAGCSRVVLCTPPDTSEHNFGGITSEILYAAQLCGITEIYRIGGAQAIAAMAYGTETIDKVDKIFGPGNSFVTEAKQQINNDPYGAVIDMPAGPSEVLVVADEDAKPDFVAADLLSQAEHGPDSQVILVSNSEKLITEVKTEIKIQLKDLPRADIAQQALQHSRFILTDTISDSIKVSNRYAPEHLIVQINNAEAYIENFTNAASIFVGEYTPESTGDYASGTNHVLPTYGYSKTLSSLNLDDFSRRYTIQTVSKEGIQTIGPAIMELAEAEGLDAHKNAVLVRLNQIEKA